MRYFIIHWMTVLMIAGSLAPAFGQPGVDPQIQRKNREQQQLRQAQAYQRTHQHENAAKILEALYAANPGDMQYYQELLESYLVLSRYPQAYQLIERQRAAAPPHLRYDADYGQVLVADNKREEALKVWDKILKSNPDNIEAYTLVASAMASNRLYEEAAEVYKKAYQRLPQQIYLLKALGDFYQARMQYYQAVQYYLEYLRKDPQNYQTVVRQILAFNLDEPQVDSLSQLLSREAQKSPGSEEVQLVSAKFYQKYQRYPEALQIYRKLENDQSGGKYFIEFARAVQADSMYALALDGYNEIIRRFPRSDHLLTAYLGAAECNLYIAREKNDPVYARQAVEIITKVRQEYPFHPQVANLSLLEGDIYRQFFFDIDRAAEIYLAVAKTYGKDADIREKAYLSAGESYIIRGELAKAIAMLEKVAVTRHRAAARYDLAKIAYYQGDYNRAGEYLKEIIQMEGASGKATNDALDLQTLLAYAQSAPEALKNYAAADWLSYQEKKSEALSKLQNALEQPAPPHFRSRILFEAAHLAGEIGKYPEALEYCSRVLNDEQLALYADEALFLTANIVDRRLNDLPRAFQLYDRLLTEFPGSQFAIAARERLKEIREQNPGMMP